MVNRPSNLPTISPDIQAAVPAGIRAAARKWGVTLAEGTSFEFDRKVPRFGNCPIAAVTGQKYVGMFHQFWNFCALFGDYESMLMLITPAPAQQVPAMKPEILEMFLRFKMMDPDNTLQDLTGSNPVKDIKNNEILCDGKWNKTTVEVSSMFVQHVLHYLLLCVTAGASFI